MIFLQKVYEFYTCSPKGNTMRRNGISIYALSKSILRDFKSQVYSLKFTKFQRVNSQHREEIALLEIPLAHPGLGSAEIISFGLM